MFNYTAQNDRRPRGMYRSRNGWFLGVCGGIAGYYGWRPGILRLIALLLILHSLGIGLVVYVVLGMLLRSA